MMHMKRLIAILLILTAVPCFAVPFEKKDSTIVEKKAKIKKKEKSGKIREKAEIAIEDTLTNEYLDTLNIRKKLEINDYSMFGFQYGAGLSRVNWNPSQKQDMVMMPVNVGVTFTKYGKMFGYMPYFGFQAGLFYSTEGYQFRYNEENDYTYKIEGAEKAIMQVVELPVLSHIHVDFWKMKIIAEIGCFAGYRLSIERFPGKTGYVRDEVAHSFIDTDRRIDYGLKGGVGIGFVFDPIEIHIKGMYKHSFSSLYQPDYYSEYFYRYAYPYNFILSAGVHFHLSKRTGQTKSQIKKLAKDMVYGNNEGNNR